MMVVGRPDVSLQLETQSDCELVLGYRTGDKITALATADAGTLQLFRTEGSDAE